MGQTISELYSDPEIGGRVEENSQKRKILTDRLEAFIGDGAILRYSFPKDDRDRVFISQMLNRLTLRGYELGGGTVEKDNEGNTVKVSRKGKAGTGISKEVDFDRVVAGWIRDMDNSPKLSTGEWNHPLLAPGRQSGTNAARELLSRNQEKKTKTQKIMEKQLSRRGKDSMGKGL